MLNIEIFLKNLVWYDLSWEFSSSMKWEWYDLEDIKEYEKQDNIKRINWKLSAKYDKEYVNVYKLEKEPILDIFLDVDYNFKFFDKQIKQYLSAVEYFLKKFWIKHNIYYFNWKKIEKLDNFKNFSFIKKGNLAKIIDSYEFKNKNNYKLLVSDFLFIELKDIDKLIPYYKKLFCAILPVYDVLLKEEKVPVINWFFNKFFMKDFMQEYKQKIEKVKKFYYEFIK